MTNPLQDQGIRTASHSDTMHDPRIIPSLNETDVDHVMKLIAGGGTPEKVAS